MLYSLKFFFKYGMLSYMIYSSDIETDDLIIEALATGEMRVRDLHARIEPIHEVTIQAIYNALNQLIEAGVVWKTGVRVGLSKEWAQKVGEKLLGASTTPALKNGESITYSFISLDELDKYWKHLTLSIRGVDPEYPVYFVEPHEIWVYLSGRSKSQQEYLESFSKKGHYAFMTLGSETFHDIDYRKKFMSDYLQIELRPDAPIERNVHTTIIDDYIVSTILKDSSSQKIDECYSDYKNKAQLEDKLAQIFSEPQQTKIRLIKNKERARRLRKKLSKPFYIPKELKEKYDLF